MGFSRFDPDKDLRFIDVFKRADYQMYENKKQMKSKS
jgi:predicted nucleotidyltransferase